MLRRSFRLGLRLGLLTGIVAGIVKVLQARRSADRMAGDGWSGDAGWAPPEPPITGPGAPLAGGGERPLAGGADELASRRGAEPASAPVPSPPQRVAAAGMVIDPGLAAEVAPLADAHAATKPGAGTDSGATQADPGAAETEVTPVPDAGPDTAVPVPTTGSPTTGGPTTGGPVPAIRTRVVKKAARRADGAVSTWVEPTGMTCPPSHPVKARLASRIFHLPGMAAYDRTRPDRCYADEASAAAAGFTRAKR